MVHGPCIQIRHGNGGLLFHWYGFHRLVALETQERANHTPGGVAFILLSGLCLLAAQCFLHEDCFLSEIRKWLETDNNAAPAQQKRPLMNSVEALNPNETCYFFFYGSVFTLCPLFQSGKLIKQRLLGRPALLVSTFKAQAFHHKDSDNDLCPSNGKMCQSWRGWATVWACLAVLLWGERASRVGDIMHHAINFADLATDFIPKPCC